MGKESADKETANKETASKETADKESTIQQTCKDTDNGAVNGLGADCSFYSTMARKVYWCSQDASMDDSDFTISEMCCACGGGVGPGSSHLNVEQEKTGSVDKESADKES